MCLYSPSKSMNIHSHIWWLLYINRIIQRLRRVLLVQLGDVETHLGVVHVSYPSASSQARSSLCSYSPSYYQWCTCKSRNYNWLFKPRIPNRPEELHEHVVWTGISPAHHLHHLPDHLHPPAVGLNFIIIIFGHVRTDPFHTGIHPLRIPLGY